MKLTQRRKDAKKQKILEREATKIAKGFGSLGPLSASVQNLFTPTWTNSRKMVLGVN
jgi:hypothetical protein